MTPAHTSTIDVFDDAVLLDPYPTCASYETPEPQSN
jgi:hypothetical protein